MCKSVSRDTGHDKIIVTLYIVGKHVSGDTPYYTSQLLDQDTETTCHSVKNLTGKTLVNGSMRYDQQYLRQGIIQNKIASFAKI